jgi:hypothetical protein
MTRLKLDDALLVVSLLLVYIISPHEALHIKVYVARTMDMDVESRDETTRQYGSDTYLPFMVIRVRYI